MKLLLDLVNVVNRNKAKRINLLDLQDKRAEKVNELYIALTKGKIKDDEDAWRVLYGGGDGKRNALSNTKKRLRDRLLNTLFFIDLSDKKFTDRQEAYYRLQKDYAAAQLLLVRHAKYAAVWQLKRVLADAKKFEFTDLVLAVARQLRLHYSTIGDYQLFNEMDVLCQQSLKEDNLTILAEGHYARLIAMYRDPKQDDRIRLRGKAQSYWRELKKDFDEVTSYGFRLHALQIQLFSHTILNDYASCLTICREALDFFESKPFRANTPIQTCKAHLMFNFIQSGDYEGGLKEKHERFGLVEEGGANWFNELGIFFLLAMHSGKYQDAYKHYLEARNHRQFLGINNEAAQQSWDLCRYYLQLLQGLGKIEGEAQDERFSAFKLSRFENSFQELKKDKLGKNLAVIIITFLFVLKVGDHEGLIKQTEKLRRYLRQYNLDRPETKRAFLFLKLLLKLHLYDFQRATFENEVREVLLEFEESNRLKADLNVEAEIIPFETLWGFTREILLERRKNG